MLKFIVEKTSILPFTLLLCISLNSCFEEHEKALQISFEFESTAPQIRYGVQKLEAFIWENKIRVPTENSVLNINGTIDSLSLDPEAYAIESKNDMVKLTGGDATGLLYGLLNIKEQLKKKSFVTDTTESPHLSFRALKFNLPWDAYRSSETLRQHTKTCRDTIFWKNFMDMMVDNRFNKLTLWNLHPFDYLVKTKKYPEASSFSDQELQEWQQFWHSLFRMAKNRGIETYLVNWNIFVPKKFALHHKVSGISQNNKKHLGKGDTSEIVKDYMRESVRETINTYPNLTGLGITLGEGMGDMTAEEREEWVLETIVEGARQANRKIKFIHRVPLSAGKSPAGSTSVSVEEMTRKTLDTLTCFKKPIQIELKFNWSHAHSSTKLVKVHGGKLSDTYWNPMPSNYRLAWMMRNEDFFILRWGQPKFIRDHIKENVHPYVNGYYIGSETYIPAKDYITSLDGASYTYAFERQWMFYKMWGRLLYDPTTPDSYFVHAFEQRFPGYGKILFAAQSKVSQVPLIIASYWDARWDFTLYSEGMLGFNEGKPAVKLLSLKTLANKTPMDPDYMGIKEYLGIKNKDLIEKITPIQLADSLQSFCRKALLKIRTVNPEENIDLLHEKTDIEAWSYLGLYFSNKLRAATAFQQYQNTKKSIYHQEAISWLEKATENWDNLVGTTTPVYQPVPIEHKGYRRDNNLFHWSIVQKEVLAELEWLRSLPNQQ